MLTLGIDPGVKGAVATSDGWVRALPILGKPRQRRLDSGALHDLVEDSPGWSIDFAVIERQQPMPKEGRSSVFTGGVIYGGLISWLQMQCIPFEEVSPATWKRSMGVASDKEQAVAKALSMFPAARDQIIGPRGGRNHNMAEALLLAEYARRLRAGRAA